MTLRAEVRLGAPLRLDARFEIRGFTALLGRSGAGKTTLLKALAGLLPSEGVPWSGLPAAARPVGYLPQGAGLFPHLTALQNAAYALPGPARLGQAQALLDELGIGPLGRRRADALSGGEAQRVALARALGRRPELLLLDEPAAALDAGTRDELLPWLIATVTQRGVPALAATHDPAIAGLADWLVLLDGGRIIRQGRPREVYDNPGTAAAAALLGFENIWRENGRTYAIRACDIEIAVRGRAATVLSAREQGHDLRLACAMPETLTVLARGRDAADFVPGGMVFLTFPPGRLKELEG